MGLGAFTLAIAILAIVAWAGYLVSQSRVRRRRREPAPQNLSPFKTDEELESKRLNTVLVAALVTTIVMAIVMPIYYLDESGRQAAATEHFEDIAVERGEHLFEEFQCVVCHGPDGGGGGASFIEARSGLSTTWSAPAINNVLYRYTPDEVRYWIVFGRAGTPMPAWGTEGGGPLNSQQVDEVIAFLDHIQIPQEEAVAQVESRVGLAERRLDGADAPVEAAIAAQLAEMAAIEAAPQAHEAARLLPDRLIAILTSSGMCTAESAELVRAPCGAEGVDTDRDGLSDVAEAALADVVAEMLMVAPPSSARSVLEAVDFDPVNPFSTSSGGDAVADLESAEAVRDAFVAIARDLRLLSENGERLLGSAESGLSYLLGARDQRRYAIDLEAIAAIGFDGDVAAATRGTALFNAYCARCHTAGYSAGVAFTQEAGSGAFGPSLRDGRSLVQFPNPEDHLDFIIKGSENAKLYGVNGIGRGWMPGFGAVLSRSDLQLIVDFERSLR